LKREQADAKIPQVKIDEQIETLKRTIEYNKDRIEYKEDEIKNGRIEMVDGKLSRKNNNSKKEKLAKETIEVEKVEDEQLY